MLYKVTDVTTTPWGEAEKLADRKLSPGPGRDQETVGRHQRERLLAATLAVVAERGYESTRVEDVLAVAGVSRNAFYRHFSNKRECFVATMEATTAFARPAVLDVYDSTPGTWDRKIVAMLGALANVIVTQPAVARAGWVEVYAAGPEAIDVVERVDRDVEEIICRALEESPEHAGMPREMVSAVVGGVRKTVHAYVREQRTDELPALMPELFDWMCSYHPPPEPLRASPRVPAELATPGIQSRDPRSRIYMAIAELVAEKGYPEMTITEIATRASVSLTTFYANFDGKEAAFLATLADAQQRLFAATVAHGATEPDWQMGVVAGLRAFLGFLATDPTTAHLGGVGVWATSAAGLDLRAGGLSRFSALLAEGYRQYPDTTPVAADAIGATLDALLFASLRRKGAQRLYEIAPLATFITLAPFVGTAQACELASASPVTIGQTIV